MSNADDLERLRAIEVALEARWPETRIAPTLERISALVDALGSPQMAYPTIHVGGTNGKTTTARMIDSLMGATGLRTGRFTSPHLESMLERIAINNHPIEVPDFIFAYNDVALYLDFIDKKFEHPISFFEAMTALAFVAFSEYPVDIGVIEVGMGGEWDSTNVVQAAVSVLTPIGFDHMAYLGNTLSEIAHTKAGIIKPGSMVVSARQELEVATELLRRVAEVGADVAREGVEYSLQSRAIAVGGQLITIKGLGDTYSDIFLPLHGEHQGSNAATALAAVEAFFGGQALDPEAVNAGFAAVTSPGRCEVVHREPTIILDAAHNPHGASALVRTLQSEFTFDTLIGIFGAFADKDVVGILTELEKVIDTIILTQSSSTRAMPTAEVERIAREIFGSDRTIAISDLESALENALAQANSPSHENSVGIVVTGSVVTVGEARGIIRKIPRLESAL